MRAAVGLGYLDHFALFNKRSNAKVNRRGDFPPFELELGRDVVEVFLSMVLEEITDPLMNVAGNDFQFGGSCSRSASP